MDRKAINKAYADKTVDARELESALKSIRDGRVPRSATLLAFGWGQKEIELIREGGFPLAPSSNIPNTIDASERIRRGGMGGTSPAVLSRPYLGQR
jgi:hypothetical protein